MPAQKRSYENATTSNDNNNHTNVTPSEVIEAVFDDEGDDTVQRDHSNNLEEQQPPQDSTPPAADVDCNGTYCLIIYCELRVCISFWVLIACFCAFFVLNILQNLIEAVRPVTERKTSTFDIVFCSVNYFPHIAGV